MAGVGTVAGVATVAGVEAGEVDTADEVDKVEEVSIGRVIVVVVSSRCGREWGRQTSRHWGEWIRLDRNDPCTAQFSCLMYTYDERLSCNDISSTLKLESMGR